MTSYIVWNYCGKDCLPWRFRSPRNDDPGKKCLFQRQRDWSNLAGIQTVHSRLTSSQHIPTVPETPNSLLVIWFQSCVAQSPAYCHDCSAFLVTIIPCITSLSQSNLIGLPTFWQREQERNRLFTRPIFPCGEKRSGNKAGEYNHTGAQKHFFAKCPDTPTLTLW